MGIKLNVSNDLTRLSEKLTDAVRRRRDDVFRPHWLVTQTDGMNAWLKLRIATELGIAANINFCKPTDIISRLHLMLTGPGKTLLEKETMRWHIYSILADDEFRQDHPDIAAYYEGNDIKQIALADEVTDLFDQYQVYRDEKIAEWNLGPDNGDPDLQWQSWIWRKLKARLGDGFIDRTQLSGEILSKIRDPQVQEQIRQKMPELHFFGLAVVTPYYLKIFHAMAEFVDIHFYLVNPAPEKYWLHDLSEKAIARLRNVSKQSVTVGNELLSNWGRIIRESFLLLFQSEDFINVYDNVGDVALPEPQTLLGKIQYDIHENLPEAERTTITQQDLADGSLVINGCYSPAREVEVLYNYLVELVDRSEEPVSPRDILVCMTNVALYAPYIKAVFNNAPYKLPFSMADEPVTAENNLFTALQNVLDMDLHPFKAEQVMQLLESPHIRKRFGITDTDALWAALRQAGIRYSVEGRVEDETRFVSWAYGMKRMLYGICMSGEPRFDDGEDILIPLDTDEGASAFERIRFIHFVNTLVEKLEKRNQSRTIGEWAAYLNEIMNDLLFESGDEDNGDYAQFMNLIDEMGELQDTYTGEVSFEVFRHSFLRRLVKETRASGFAAQGITFASMVPMRSIPFRVVALLGIDFEKFPRKETGLSFSLIHKKPLAGDRDMKANDKHLFLESLLSAKEYFYISYQSRSDRDNTKLPPSGLVDECMDYIARQLMMDTDTFRDAFVKQHPLQGHSPKYGRELKSYLNEERFRTGITIRSTDPRLKDMDLSEVDIRQISGFMKNPFKVFFNRQLDVRYAEDEILLPDHEVFELDSLQQWKLKYDLLREEPDLREYLYEKKLRAEVPLANMSEVAVMQINREKEFQKLKEQYRETVRGQEEREEELSLNLDGTRLKGKVSLHGDRYIHVCISGSWPKYLLDGMVGYLSALASGHELSFHFLTSKNGTHEIQKNIISAGQAREILEHWLGLMKRGHMELVEFYPVFLNLSAGHNLLVELSYAEFSGKVGEKMEEEEDHSLDDDYLMKASDNGIFSEDRYPNWQSNVMAIAGPLRTYLPKLFK
jgi:exodeoxyribonuclease V gamma subunit